MVNASFSAKISIDLNKIVPKTRNPVTNSAGFRIDEGEIYTCVEKQKVMTAICPDRYLSI